MRKDMAQSVIVMMAINIVMELREVSLRKMTLTRTRMRSQRRGARNRRREVKGMIRRQGLGETSSRSASNSE